MSPMPRPLHAAALRALAAELRDADAAGTPSQPLRGRNVALLTPDPATPPAAALTRAARSLGAQLVHVRPDSLPPASSPARAETLALLGRLYDAVIASGAPDPLVQAVAAHIDRPVLTEDVGDDADALDPWLLQAWLLDAMA